MAAGIGPGAGWSSRSSGPCAMAARIRRHLDHRQHAVERGKPGQRGPQRPARQRAGREEGRQHTLDRPGLSSRVRRPASRARSPPRATESPPPRGGGTSAASMCIRSEAQDEGGRRNNAIIAEADRGHDAEAPEQQADIGDRVPGRRLDLLRRRGARVGHLPLEQQRIAQVALVRLEPGALRRRRSRFAFSCCTAS